MGFTIRLMSMTASMRRPPGATLRGAVARGALLVGGTGCGSMTSDPVHEQWESRASLPSCGSLQLQQGEAVEVEGETEVACLQRALDSGRGAELTIRYPTTEGDPVTNYYRVTADGATEVYTDSTQDAFSDGKWGFASCDQPEMALDVNC